MFAITFDLVVAETERAHPKGLTQAYKDIRKALEEYGFSWVQGSVYVSQKGDLADLTRAIMALQGLPWFGSSIRDIRAFKMVDYSDFTPLFKDTR